MTLSDFGAFGFGAIIGWYIYYVNRYRHGDVQLSDITTLIGAIGGAAILKMFDPGTSLFGAYGVGIFIGFFGYLAFLGFLVAKSDNFTIDFFLDGRRKVLAPDQTIPGDVQQAVRALGVEARQFGTEQVGAPGVAARVASLERDVAALSGNGRLVIPVVVQDQASSRVATAAATWVPSPAAQKIIDACNDAWDDDTKTDCNKYVKAVMSALGHADFGAGEDANAIAADLADNNWLSTKGWRSVANGAAAKAEADKGRIVVGAISGGNYVPPVAHGHVVVVVSSETLHKGKYPFAYWGKLGSVGERNAPITHAFNAASADKVVYAARDA